MVKCGECGKKLSFFGGYQHPTMGKKQSLCSSCFHQVNESVEKWKEFVMSNAFKNKTPNTMPRLSWDNMFTKLPLKENIFEKFFTKADNCFEEVKY